MDDAIHIFIYSLKLYLKNKIKAQVQAMIDASLNKVMTVVLKLDKMFSMVFRCHNPFDPSKRFHHEDN